MNSMADVTPNWEVHDRDLQNVFEDIVTKHREAKEKLINLRKKFSEFQVATKSRAGRVEEKIQSQLLESEVHRQESDIAKENLGLKTETLNDFTLLLDNKLVEKELCQKELDALKTLMTDEIAFRDDVLKSRHSEDSVVNTELSLLCDRTGISLTKKGDSCFEFSFCYLKSLTANKTGVEAAVTLRLAPDKTWEILDYVSGVEVYLQLRQVIQKVPGEEDS